VHDPAAAGPYAVGLRRITFERPSTADGTPRVLDTWVWYPAEGEPGRDAVEGAPVAESGALFPVVIYSHGSGGRPDFQQYLTVHLASHGFIVAAPPHPGNTNDDCFPCTTASILPSARERPADVTFALDELIAMKGDAASDLGRIIDPERTAIVGHSFGGWTALYVAADDRFDAAVAQAPGSPQLLTQRAAGVETPLMIIASEQDEVVPIEQVYEYWSGLGAIEKRLVLLPEGVHLNYVDRCFGCREGLPEERGHELIRRYTAAWLYVHVLADGRYAPYLEADDPDAILTP
jgi:predicted dienelactone hydrolase